MDTPKQSASPSSSLKRIICVDLDGTLIREESHLVCLRWLARHKPLRLPFLLWRYLRKGSASAKHLLTQEFLACQELTYTLNPTLLTRLQSEKRKGSTLVLITGAPQVIADLVAKNLSPLFDHVIASTPHLNCIGKTKAQILNQEWGPKNYIYVGNSPQDIFPWENAQEAWIVGQNPIVHRWRQRTKMPTHHIV